MSAFNDGVATEKGGAFPSIIMIIIVFCFVLELAGTKSKSERDREVARDRASLRQDLINHQEDVRTGKRPYDGTPIDIDKAVQNYRKD